MPQRGRKGFSTPDGFLTQRVTNPTSKNTYHNSEEAFPFLEGVNSDATMDLKSEGKELMKKLLIEGMFYDQAISDTMCNWLQKTEQLEIYYERKNRKRSTPGDPVEGEPMAKSTCVSEGTSSTHTASIIGKFPEKNSTPKYSQGKAIGGPSFSPLTKKNLQAYNRERNTSTPPKSTTTPIGSAIKTTNVSTIRGLYEKQLGPSAKMMEMEKNQLHFGPKTLSKAGPPIVTNLRTGRQTPLLLNTSFPERGFATRPVLNKQKTINPIPAKNTTKAPPNTRNAQQPTLFPRKKRPMQADDPLVLMQLQMEKAKEKTDKTITIDLCRTTYELLYQQNHPCYDTRQQLPAARKRATELRTHKP